MIGWRESWWREVLRNRLGEAQLETQEQLPERENVRWVRWGGSQERDSLRAVNMEAQGDTCPAEEGRLCPSDGGFATNMGQLQSCENQCNWI